MVFEYDLVSRKGYIVNMIRKDHVSKIHICFQGSTYPTAWWPRKGK